VGVKAEASPGFLVPRMMAQGSHPTGQGDTWDNKEEFQKKNCPLALLQTTQMGFPLQQINHLKSGTGPCSQLIRAALCGGLARPAFMPDI
jgi:hypothetical protein